MPSPDSADTDVEGWETCPRCHGSGLIWRTNFQGQRGAEPCTAAFRCPMCPDDGSGNSVGTGKVPVERWQLMNAKTGEVGPVKSKFLIGCWADTSWCVPVRNGERVTWDDFYGKVAS